MFRLLHPTRGATRGDLVFVDFETHGLVDGRVEVRFDSRRKQWFDRFGDEVVGYTNDARAARESFLIWVAWFAADGDRAISFRVFGYLFTETTPRPVPNPPATTDPTHSRERRKRKHGRM